MAGTRQPAIPVGLVSNCPVQQFPNYRIGRSITPENSTIFCFYGDCMNFNEQLNAYIEALECTAKQLSAASGLSESTLSRFRSGKRIPAAGSSVIINLSYAISNIAELQCSSGRCIKTPIIYNAEKIQASFLNCEDISFVCGNDISKRFDTLITALKLNMTHMSCAMHYHISFLNRIRNNKRSPSDPHKFLTALAEYISIETEDENKRLILADILNHPLDKLHDSSLRSTLIYEYLSGRS